MIDNLEYQSVEFKQGYCHGLLDGEQRELERWQMMMQNKNTEKSSAVYPIPCVRDEHGAIKEQTVKRLFDKINEELDELKAAVLSAFYSLDVVPSDRPDLKNVNHDDLPHIAEEAADAITAITTMLEALGIDAEMRNETQRRVNKKNMERGRL